MSLGSSRGSATLRTDNEFPVPWSLASRAILYLGPCKENGMVESFENNSKYLEIHDAYEMGRLLLKLRREQGKSQRELGRALRLTLEQVVEMEKQYETIPFGAIFQPMLALYGVSLTISRQYEPPPGAYLYEALCEFLPHVRGSMRAVSSYLKDAPLQGIFQELKSQNLRIWLRIEEYVPYSFKLFRAKTQEGMSTTVSVDPRLLRTALWSLGGGRAVAQIVRESSLAFDKAKHNESRSRHVQRNLLEAIAAADKLFEEGVLH